MRQLILRKIYNIRSKIRAARIQDKDILTLILRIKALTGTHGDECKIFVQNVFRETLGITIPKNHGFEKWRWVSAPSGWTETEGGLFHAVVGDVIQVKWMDHKIRPPANWHTMIVLENKGNSIVVADSNWDRDYRVSIHEIPHEWFLETAMKFTIYHCDNL